jgi:hypothetical protein
MSNMKLIISCAFKPVFAIIFALTSTLSIRAQNDSIINSANQRDSVFTPEHYFYFNYFVDSHYRPVYSKYGVFDAAQTKIEIPYMYSYSISFGLLKQVREHIALDMAFSVSRLNVESETRYFDYDLIQPNTLQLRQICFTNDFTYITIPIGVSYTVGKKYQLGIYNGIASKFNGKEGVSVADNYYPGGGYFPEGRNKQKEYLIDGNAKFNLEYRVGMILGYKAERFIVQLMPIYRIDIFNTFRGVKWKHAQSKGLGITFMSKF